MFVKDTDISHNFKTILASDDYRALPITLTESLKAGTPVKNDGTKVAEGTGAIGLLLYDVDKDRNPNGAVVVVGTIDYEKAKASAGDGLSADVTALAKALPNLVFRDKDGKNYVGDTAAE